MKNDEIKKQLNTFEDAYWVINYGHDKEQVKKELRTDEMDKEELKEWICEAVHLFNKILTSEQPHD
jgi:uracil DNA glycosylase